MRFIILQLFQQLLASFENSQFFETAEPRQGGADSRSASTRHYHEPEQNPAVTIEGGGGGERRKGMHQNAF